MNNIIKTIALLVFAALPLSVTADATAYTPPSVGMDEIGGGANGRVIGGPSKIYNGAEAGSIKIV